MSKSAKIFFIILLALGFLTRFAFFGYPKQVVFDEIYFGQFASDYISGHYFFDIHPPLGKLLVAFAGNLSPDQPQEFMFHNIGEHYLNDAYLYLRFLPTLAGALLPALIFLLARKSKFSDMAAFFAGLLIVFDTSLITQSRLILLDSFLLIFGFSGLLAYLSYRTTRSKKIFLLSIILLTAAFCIKWTGLSFIALAGLVELYDLIKTKRTLRAWLSRFFAFCIIPIAIYVSLFALHFYLLPKSGTGDDFMSARFQKTLKLSPYEFDANIGTPNFFQKFLELHYQMVAVQSQPQLKRHPYNSKWYSWPLMLRPIYYWSGTDAESRIYLFGNPVVYWFSALAVAILSVCIILSLFIKYMRKKIINKTTTFLLVGYLANVLPFVLISRGMFLYHYLSALVFACLITGYVIDQIQNKKTKIIFISTASTLAVISFIYFAPLAYGLPLSMQSFNSHMWLSSWK